jgi:DNA polymerase-3 subunit gamma/tau
MAAVSTVVLARKYRPLGFEQMVGQEHVVRALTNALQRQRLHHAYLFTGTRGIGKTTVSRILAKSLNCTGPDGAGGITAKPCGVCPACTAIDADRFIDYIELDAASNRSIDEVRDLIERAAYKPSVGRFKVFMIDEAHQLTKDAFNALLKTLEEPPEYLKFVLATTDPDKMLPTVLSRCLQFNLRPMAPEVIVQHLQQVLAAEQVVSDAGSLRLLSRAARGSMRDALSLADQAIAYGGGKLDEAVVRSMLGAVDRSHAGRLIEALAGRDGVAVLAEVDALRGLGLSAAAALEEVAMLLQHMAVEQSVPGALGDRDEEALDAKRLAPLLSAEETQLAYSIVLHGRGELSLMSDEYAAMTMVLLRFLAFPSDSATAQPQPRTAAAAGAAPGGMARAVTLRAPVPPALTMPVPDPAPAPAASAAAATSVDAKASVATDAAGLADRWYQLVRRLDQRGGVQAMTRELAWQAALVGVTTEGSRQVWRLQVEGESLRAPQWSQKLAAVLGAELGIDIRIEADAGSPADTPARRLAAERARALAAAEESIRSDPLVVDLLQQFKGARIVPGSIKTVSPEEGSQR